MAKNPYLGVADLRGGVNDSDSKFALPETQVPEAWNLDYRFGQIGTKRGGMTPLSLTGSVFAKDRPTLIQSDAGGFSAISGTMAVSAVVTPADGTGATNHLLLVFIATKAATVVSTVVLGAAALTNVLGVSNGAAGRLEVWRLNAPALGGGTLTVTLAGAVDCAIIAERWGNVDTGVGITSVATANAVGASFVPAITAAQNPTQVFVSASSYDGAATEGIIGTYGNLANSIRAQATARVQTNSILATKPTTQVAYSLSGAVAWTAGWFLITGRAAVLNFQNHVVALWKFEPSNSPGAEELWAQDAWGRIDRFAGGAWSGGVAQVNAAIGTFGTGTTTSFTGPSRTNGIGIHGKNYIALDGTIGADRTHLYDPVTGILRWMGLAPPPTLASVANTGGAGTYATTRYFRTRWTEQQNGVTVRRSEPCASTTFTPGGANTGALLSRPTDPTFSGLGAQLAEGATHWEVEASTDNVLFYRISTQLLAATTYTDSTAFAGVSTYSSFTLSPNIGEYTTFPAVRYVFADDDRPMGAGSNAAAVLPALTTAANVINNLESRVYWTVLAADLGDGNDERNPTGSVTTRFFLDLDAQVGGRINHVVAGSVGAIYAFKNGAIYKLVRTGRAAKAYDSVIETRARGATQKGACEGIDEKGQPCIYFGDPVVGICRFSVNGVEDLMQTRRRFAARFSLLSTVPAVLVFNPKQWLVYCFLSVDGGTIPSACAVFNIRTHSWTDYTGSFATVVAGAIVRDVTTRVPTIYLAPWTQGTSQITLGDSGVNDDGVRFRAYLTTKPFQWAGLMGKFGIMAGVLHAVAQAATTIGIGLIRDLGKERKDITVSIAPTGVETNVEAVADNAVMSGCEFVQFEIGDPVSFAGAQLDQTWTLDEWVAKCRGEDEATS